MSTVPQIASIFVDKEHIVAALIDADDALNTRIQVSLLPESTDKLEDHIVAVYEKVIQATDTQKVAGIGIALTSRLLASTELQVEQFQHDLQDMLKLPIIVERDINISALAEVQINAQHTPNTAIYLHIDTDIVGVILQDGHLWEAINANSDQIANLVTDWMGTKPITLGDRASGQGIANEYNMRSKTHRTPSLDEIIQYAKQGDHLAIRVIRDGAHLLGSVSYPALMLLNPDLVIVGGRFAMSGDLWWQSFSAAFLKNRVNTQVIPKLVRATHDDDATLYYAAVVVRNHLQGHKKQ